jgi:nucleotide sugar dehydrogenase
MKVCVVGLGKIGVPLAVQFASKGAQVVGYDIDDARCEAINRGESPLHDEPGVPEALSALAAAGKLFATTDAGEAMSGADAVVFIVPVDVDASNRPDFAMLDAAVEAIGPHVAKGMLVLVETTVPVGTTRHRVAARIGAASGLRAGADFAVAFSPERVSSGTVLLDLRRYPKIVGGIDETSAQRAADFYRQVLDAEVMVVRDAETAEYSKLLETTYRDVNIALANEFARAGDALGVDTREAIAAANSQPFSHIHAPGPGVGGHCIPVYPYFIDAPQVPGGRAAARDLVAASREINDGMARYCVERLEEGLGGLKGTTVVVLGLAYRANVKEVRHSSAFGLLAALRDAGARAFVHDPLFTDDEIRSVGAEPVGVPFVCDAIVVQAWHKQYADLDFAAIAGLRAVLDTRANVDRRTVEHTGAAYLGIGIG